MSTTARDGTVTAEWFDTLFKAIIGISTLGAGFTFGTIFGDIGPNVPPPNFDPDHVRRCLAACWLLFVLALAVASFAGTLLALDKDWIKRAQDEGRMLLPSLISLLLQLLIVGAFVAASLAIAAYDQGVGWAAVALTTLVGFIILGIWIYTAVSFCNGQVVSLADVNICDSRR